MQDRQYFFAAFLVVAAAAAHGTEPVKLESAGALFGMRETVEQMDLSPDGRRVIYVSPGPGRTSIAYTADLDSGVEQVVLRSTGSPERLQWCRFTSNTRVICQVSGIDDSTGVLVPFSRLLAVGIDGADPKLLGQRASAFDGRHRQFDGDVVDWLAGDDEVLLARDYIPEINKTGSRLVRDDDGVGLDRVNVRTMRSTTIERPSKLTDFFLSDGRGTVRIKGNAPERDSSGQLASYVNYLYRLPDSREWLPFSRWGQGDGMAPVAVEAESNSAYVLKKLDGRIALYRVKLDGTMHAELLYKHDRVDVDDVVRIGKGGRVIGVTFADEARSVVYFDPEFKKLSSSLGRALPNLPLVAYLGASSDGSRLLLHAGSDIDPGRYYLFDKSKGRLAEIMLSRPVLEKTVLAQVKPIEYPAGDGTPIPAYLTLPPGRETVRGLPAVVLPHGGPSARDEWGFDWLAQFFANRGYVVVQPNYRGSSGYGDEWLQQNGFRSWRTSIGDVAAAGRWLVSEGIADPAKVAVVGWSYGGYAALQSSAVDPDLFKAIVAIAPVTSLERVKKDALDYTSARNVAEQIGSGLHVQQGSPLNNVEHIRAPVLMFHGTMDMHVGVRHSRDMDDALRGAGKSSELVEFAGLEHSLVDSDARAAMLDRIDAFLAMHLAL